MATALVSRLTRSEARRLVMEAYPGRSVCLEIQDWHYASANHVRAHDEIGYKVSVLPGPDGSVCQQWTGKTLEATVVAAIDTRRPGAAEADEQFDPNMTNTEWRREAWEASHEERRDADSSR